MEYPNETLPFSSKEKDKITLGEKQSFSPNETTAIKQLYNFKDELGNIRATSFENYKKIYKFIQKFSLVVPNMYNEKNITTLKIEPLEKSTLIKLKDDYNNKNYNTVIKKLDEIASLKPTFIKRNKKLKDEQGQIWEVSQEIINIIKSRLLIPGFI